MKTRLLTTLIAVFLALSAWANGTKIGGIYYLLDSDTKTASVTYTGTYDEYRNPYSTAYRGYIIIPASVTNPADGATYPVTTIGNYAFYGCEGLTSITIPNSVTSIGEMAFARCTGLTSVTIPNSVTSIEYGAFASCSGLTSVTIPNSVTSIGEGAFDGCTGLTSVTIPNSVTSIGDMAFYGCKGLTSVTIGNSVTTIGRIAFRGCTGLTSITIPNSVTTIERMAFSYCTSLTSIKVETGNTKYDSRDNCNAIIETASNTLVAGCKATSIPSSVTNIGNFAFYGCKGLTSITIPSSVTSIEIGAFAGCEGLTSIEVEAGNTQYDSREACNAIIETESNTLIAGCMNSTIPNSVTSIEEYAFEDCTSLTSITIPNSVTSIGREAFWGCSGLTSVTIGNSVTSIGIRAFEYCTGLTDIYALRTDPKAYNCRALAFNGASTSTCTLHVPKGCKEAYASKAPWSSFANIVDDIDTGSDDAVVLTADGEDVWTDGVLRFSVSSEENGEAAVSGVKNQNLTTATIPEKVKIADKVYSVTSIGWRAFRDCTGLTSISIPESVTTIGVWAFDCCTGLTSITIPSSVTSIGGYAFYGCTGLTNITIPSSVKSIWDRAFYGCTGLTSITIPSSVTYIGSGAFSWCSGLTSIKVEAGNTEYDSRDNCNAIIETASNTLVAGCKATTIPSSVTSIGGEAFYGCTGLTSVEIPNSVTSIGGEAFNGCSGLTSIKVETGNATYDSRESCNAIIETESNRLVAGCQATTIPSSVTSIADYAFNGCTGLTDIVIPSYVTSIGSQAFFSCTGLKSITVKSSDPGTYHCSTTAFNDYSATLHVPKGSKEAYAGTSPWSKFTSIVDDIDTDSDDAVVLTADGENVWTDGVLRFSVSSEENGEAVVSGVKDKDNLCAVTIPEKVKIADKVYSVTSIGSYAFWDCTDLTSITFPESVTSIGNYAFQYCSGLTSITIPNSVTSIRKGAFDGCSGLTSVTINSNDVVSKTYTYDSNLRNIFGSQVTTYIIGDNVTSIGEWAFYRCTGLTSITIPSSVTSIGDYAFEYCSGLTSIEVEAGNTQYDSREACNAIIETESNTLIAGCMKTIIPNSVTSIGGYAFTGCTGLTSINITASVTSIGRHAFAGCSGLTSIEVEAGNTQYDSREACNAIIETESNTLIAGCMNTIIPNSVTSIGDGAFSNCSGLTSITIPNSVTSIGSFAFDGCTGLTSITIPKSVMSIGNEAFRYCTSLTSIEIPNSVTSIGRWAFGGCEGLTSIEIPESVTSIGSDAFRYCTGLTDIYALRTDPAAYDCATDAFSDYSATLHVPAGSKEAYASTEPWNNFANIVEEEDLTAIQSLTLSPSEASESYYNLQGQRIAEPQRGQLVVVRRADGSSRKMYVR